MGLEYLGKVLSKHLEAVIRAPIPNIAAMINKTIDDIEAELNQIGRPLANDVEVSGSTIHTILELCKAFDCIFKEHLDISRPGGEKIYLVFDNQLPAALKKLLFDKQFLMQNARKIVSEANGYQPHLIAPKQGYRRLIESWLVLFRGPAVAVVDATHFILRDLVRRSIGECVELKRYPSLQAELAQAAIEALEKIRDDSKKTALRWVDM